MTASAPGSDTRLEIRYPGAEACYERAWVRLPGEPGGELRDRLSRLAALAEGGVALPLVIFMVGSSDRGWERRFGGWMDDLPGVAMLAPCTHAIPGRPVYTSPAAPKVYQAVHDLRRAEIDYVLHRLVAAPALSTTRIAIVGLSEGAVAAASWAPERAVPRVLLAWPCEDTYFARSVPLPRDPETPILNVMGWRDRFFGPRDSLSSRERIEGHGATALGAYPRAKVVIYPAAGHQLLDVPETRLDVMRFLRMHLCQDPPTARSRNRDGP